eukprot:SAG31_NODE_1056_length_10132_cov_2.873816_2_plen_562_part_00
MANNVKAVAAIDARHDPRLPKFVDGFVAGGLPHLCKASLCSDITRMNLSCIGLTPLGAANLVQLVCSESALLELNLSCNCDLFGLPDTPDHSGWDKLCGVLSMSRLSCLIIREAGMGPEAVKRLADALKPENPFNSSLKTLDISYNNCFGRAGPDKDQTGWKWWCESLPGSALEKLLIANIGMGPAGMFTLAHAIRHVPGLTELDVSENPVGDEGAEVLFEALCCEGSSPSVRNDEVGTAELDKLAAEFDRVQILARKQKYKIPCVSKLNISRCNIGVRGIIAMSRSIPFLTGLEELRLDNNPVTGAIQNLPHEEGGGEDGENNSISGSVTTQAFAEWQHCDIDTSGFAEFCASLAPSSLSRLSLSYCGIGPSGLLAVASAVDNSSLCWINLDGNPITGAKRNEEAPDAQWEAIDSDISGMLALGDALKASGGACDLSTNDCHIGEKVEAAMKCVSAASITVRGDPRRAERLTKSPTEPQGRSFDSYIEEYEQMETERQSRQSTNSTSSLKAQPAKIPFSRTSSRASHGTSRTLSTSSRSSHGSSRALSSRTKSAGEDSRK